MGQIIQFKKLSHKKYQKSIIRYAYNLEDIKEW